MDEDANATMIRHLSTPLRGVFVAVLYLALGGLFSATNGLMTLVIIFTRRLRAISYNWLIACLASADSIFAFGYVIVGVLQLSPHLHWALAQRQCMAILFLSGWANATQPILTLTIALDRFWLLFLSHAHPSVKPIDKLKQYQSMEIAFCLAAGLALNTLAASWTESDTLVATCNASTAYTSSFKRIFCLYSAVSNGLTMCIYASIHIKLNRLRPSGNCKQTTTKTHLIFNLSATATRMKVKDVIQSHRSSYARVIYASYTALIVAIIDVTCWMLGMLVFAGSTFTGSTRAVQVAGPLAGTLVLLSAGSNFFVYMARSVVFRKAFMEFFGNIGGGIFKKQYFRLIWNH